MKSKMLFLERNIYWRSRQLLSRIVFGANLLKIGCYKVYRWKLWFQIDFINRKYFFNKAVFSTDQHWNRSSWINTNSLQYVSNLELHSSRMVLFVLYHDLAASSTSSTGFIMTKLCIWRAGASSTAEMSFWKFQSEPSVCVIYRAAWGVHLTYWADNQFEHHYNIIILW